MHCCMTGHKCTQQQTPLLSGSIVRDHKNLWTNWPHQLCKPSGARVWYVKEWWLLLYQWALILLKGQTYMYLIQEPLVCTYTLPNSVAWLTTISILMTSLKNSATRFLMSSSANTYPRRSLAACLVSGSDKMFLKTIWKLVSEQVKYHNRPQLHSQKRRKKKWKQWTSGKFCIYLYVIKAINIKITLPNLLSLATVYITSESLYLQNRPQKLYTIYRSSYYLYEPNDSIKSCICSSQILFRRFNFMCSKLN